MTFASDRISEHRAFSSRLCAWAVFCVCEVYCVYCVYCEGLILDSALITTQAYREDNR